MKSEPTIYIHNNLTHHLKKLQKFEEYMSNKLKIPQSKIPEFNEENLLHTDTDSHSSILLLNDIRKKIQEELKWKDYNKDTEAMEKH